VNKSDELRKTFKDIEQEIEAENLSKLSDEARQLHRIARSLLMLERDLNVPGAKKSQDDRVERLLELIAKEAL
jgi:replicative DNA helicase